MRAHSSFLRVLLLSVLTAKICWISPDSKKKTDISKLSLFLYAGSRSGNQIQLILVTTLSNSHNRENDGGREEAEVLRSIPWLLLLGQLLLGILQIVIVCHTWGIIHRHATHLSGLGGKGWGRGWGFKKLNNEF